MTSSPEFCGVEVKEETHTMPGTHGREMYSEWKCVCPASAFFRVALPDAVANYHRKLVRDSGFAKLSYSGMNRIKRREQISALEAEIKRLKEMDAGVSE